MVDFREAAGAAEDESRVAEIMGQNGMGLAASGYIAALDRVVADRCGAIEVSLVLQKVVTLPIQR